ncbi:2-succinyl-5-enolpyruvyl-6-hydroxy-3-cyclohexene-1-carboxylic-acid synthase [Phocicoccus pinnipedialis]|uniref:2-succinyl-5-enolpyruvyl-6-hydroxy-3-cyclohexene-1-carboxylate synthase n=1 Tax=Phocicoccus pinnipedialis TaxID=110845 RepID=A0A6V7RBT3_9BACL|nr:2-succinyl-5-enolpyruvyl-6-hydroxy-3-cyclohexene-1-carboxylic-acid synthase [Jeotgalicoccus pinnipedialis]MBP1939577.1 2-succinyl-5-enolpyruvyl-6-hydroxy-3-cyclohexene-1-carboxylate synthase [Jeotgalicoccus pinnipedialis]CAD2074917.1 2-succinyl-5-enolpyruvyl-6-hydroxy-3-cyclohexene-1-carboxylate synthase [Jeotgalicoccus pinnipedialis]
MSHTEALTEQVFTLVDELYKYGMTSMVISPGSRSTPIAIAAELHPKITTYVHPDERGAAFFALGKIKTSNSPVGVLCTSGTAAANYVPAVSEAGLSHLPLVVITSDRPYELRNVGAPQAINQTNMYENFVRYHVEFPIAEAGDVIKREVQNRVLQASMYFTGVNRGPIAINIPIREPLMPDLTRNDLFVNSKVELIENITIPKSVDEISGKVLLIIGETNECLEELSPLFNYRNVSTIMDPRQNMRVNLDNVITTHDLIFSNISNDKIKKIETEFDYIVRVGEPVTSKSTNQFLSKVKLPQILVSEFIDIKPFPVTPEKTYVGNITNLLSRLIKESEEESVLLELDKIIREFISEKIVEYDDEGRYMYEIIKKLINQQVFLSSSMPIRDFERYDVDRKLKVYANRGANGIDGVVSSAMGAATVAPTTLIIGDVAMNHDINGLLLAKLENIDITVIVFNNNGGNIFSYLPQYQEKTHFERLFGTPLDLDFKHAAELYDFEYYRVQSYKDLTDDLLNKQGRVFIEIMTDREDNLHQHQHLRKEVEFVVQSFEL